RSAAAAGVALEQVEQRRVEAVGCEADYARSRLRIDLDPGRSVVGRLEESPGRVIAEVARMAVGEPGTGPVCDRSRLCRIVEPERPGGPAVLAPEDGVLA